MAQATFAALFSPSAPLHSRGISADHMELFSSDSDTTLYIPYLTDAIAGEEGALARLQAAAAS